MTIDKMLAAADWTVQSKKEVNLLAAVGVIEAKRVEEGERKTKARALPRSAPSKIGKIL